jgi:hypothetical protein
MRGSGSAVKAKRQLQVLFSRQRTLWGVVGLWCVIAVCVRVKAQSLPAASVGFTLDFPGSMPEHYSLIVYSDGKASYESKGKLTPDADAAESFHLDFQVSPEMRVRVFDLAAKAKYFEGKIDSGKKNLASTGQKTLSFTDAQRNTEAQYNYSPVPAVQELTAVFQGTSTTLEFGHRLAYYHQYQKLALDEELKRMEEENRLGNMAELQAIAPILKDIINDASVINVTRARAQKLLALAGHPDPKPAS